MKLSTNCGALVWVVAAGVLVPFGSDVSVVVRATEAPTVAPTTEGCCSWTFNTCVDDSEQCAGKVGCQRCNGFWLDQRPTDTECTGIYSDCNGALADTCCKGLICLLNSENQWSSCALAPLDTPNPTPSVPTTSPTRQPTVEPTIPAPPVQSITKLPFSKVEYFLQVLVTRNLLEPELLTSPRFSSAGLVKALSIMYEYGIGDEDDADGYFFYLGEAATVVDEPEGLEAFQADDDDEDDPFALEYRYGLTNVALFLSQLVALDNFTASNICPSNNSTTNLTTTTTALKTTTGRSSPCGAIGTVPLCDLDQTEICSSDVYPIAQDVVCACVLGQLNSKLGISKLDLASSPRWTYYSDGIDFCDFRPAGLCRYRPNFDEGTWLVPMASWILNVQRYSSPTTGWNYIEEVRKLVDSEMDVDVQRILLRRVSSIVTQGTHIIPYDLTAREPSEDAFDLVISMFQEIQPSVFDKPMPESSSGQQLSSKMLPLMNVLLALVASGAMSIVG